MSEDPKKPDTWLVQLKAKSPDTAYDSIKLWVTKAPLGLPVRGEYFTSSGKMLRSADFAEVKEFSHGHKRPSHITMRNEIATQRFSELKWQELDVSVTHRGRRCVVILARGLVRSRRRTRSTRVSPQRGAL